MTHDEEINAVLEACEVCRSHKAIGVVYRARVCADCYVEHFHERFVFARVRLGSASPAEAPALEVECRARLAEYEAAARSVGRVPAPESLERPASMAALLALLVPSGN